MPLSKPSPFSDDSERARISVYHLHITKLLRICKQIHDEVLDIAAQNVHARIVAGNNMHPFNFKLYCVRNDIPTMTAEELLRKAKSAGILLPLAAVMEDCGMSQSETCVNLVFYFASGVKDDREATIAVRKLCSMVHVMVSFGAPSAKWYAVTLDGGH